MGRSGSVIPAVEVEMRRVLVISGVVVQLVLAVLVGIVFHHDAGQWRAGGTLPVAAAFMLVAAPAIIAIWALHETSMPALIAAGLACIPAAVLSVVTLPSVVAAALLLSGLRQYDPTGRRVFLAVFVMACQVIAAVDFVAGRANYNFHSGQADSSGSYLTSGSAGVILLIIATEIIGSILWSERLKGPRRRGPSVTPE